MKNPAVRTDDPRFQRSMNALYAAVQALLEAHPVAEISITRVVEVAGVARPTFYQHFRDMPDAARQVAFSRLAKAFPMPDPLPAQFALEPHRLADRLVADALPSIRHLSEHREFYLRVLDGAGTATFLEALLSLMSSRFLPEPLEYAARKGRASREDIETVMAGGIMWLVIGWLRNEAGRAKPEALAERVVAIVLLTMNVTLSQEPG